MAELSSFTDSMYFNVLFCPMKPCNYRCLDLVNSTSNYFNSIVVKRHARTQLTVLHLKHKTTGVADYAPAFGILSRCNLLAIDLFFLFTVSIAAICPNHLFILSYCAKLSFDTRA